MTTELRTLKIDLAKLEDIPEIESIALDGRLSSWTHEDYANEIKRSDSIFLAARMSKSALVGFMFGRLISASEGEQSFDFEICNFGVNRKFRRIGVGTALFKKLVELSDRYHFQKCWLEVRSRNQSAIAFYRRLGFKTAYTRNGYYHDPVDDANVMNAVV